MIHPYAIPFLQRTGDWLEKLRVDRVYIKKEKKPRLSTEEKFMKDFLAMLSPEQMEGYLKGLKK